MDAMHERSVKIFGERCIQFLQKKHVAVFGLGGVGGHAAEALCRGGIGTLTLVDCETYDRTNCNRQIFATAKTIGMRKTEAATNRLKEINPSCNVQAFDLFFSRESEPLGLFEGVDYILDAIDSVSSKLYLIERANTLGIPIISSMGTGNKLDPTLFRVADLYQTSVCPLARVMRRECKRIGIPSLKVVYSEELPTHFDDIDPTKTRVPGSTSFVPGVAGMILAGEIIKDFYRECLSSEQKN